MAQAKKSVDIKNIRNFSIIAHIMTDIKKL